MSNAPDQVRKGAMKRLMQDLEEIRNSPVENVSASPLDDNMFEWHCNFNLDNVPYHVILFFPKNYPYDSPSAEFVPKGFQFTGGATIPGKKGVRVCLSIFSDFAYIHTEWANEKGMGWSPGYTVQTILLNLVSFLAEMQGNGWTSPVWKTNAKLAKDFTCKDCGHTFKKPFPELPKGSDTKTTKKSPKSGGPTSDTNQIVDYISKVRFNPSVKPKDKDALYGYGLVVSGPSSRPSLTTPCEFLTGESFYGMKKSMGKVHSMLKDELAVFLTMYLNNTHGGAIQNEFESAMEQLKTIIPNCKKASLEKMVIKTIPNLMSATVVEFSKGTQHTSDNHLNGYFALHRLFLWAIETYPELQGEIDSRLEEFIEGTDRRNKKACPHIGEWLMLLSASSKYTWKEAAEAYLSESWKRNVMWYVKDDAKLGYLDTDIDYRLDHTLKATLVSRKLLAFQVLFLDIAMPAKWTRQQIIARYDKTMGFPTPEMVVEMKEAVAKIGNMKSYADWFKVLKLDPPSDDVIFDKLVKAVEYSINTDGYKWTFWKNQGGWAAVLKRYPNGTPGYSKGGAKDSEDPKGKGKGKGKKSKPEAATTEEQPATKKAKGRGKSAEPPEPEVVPGKGKGRGRGKKATADPVEPPAKGRGRGKGAKQVEEPMETDADTKGKGAKRKSNVKVDAKPPKNVKFEEPEEKPKAARGGKAGGARGRGRGKKR